MIGDLLLQLVAPLLQLGDLMLQLLALLLQLLEG